MADACAVAVAPANAPGWATTGADLLGWTALPLLGAAAGTGPWLFVATWSLARLSGIPVSDAQFTPTVADYRRPWPFADDALGGVVIDGDALARGATDTHLQGILAEATRVSGRNGTVLVVCGHRFIPRHLRAWSEYGRRSVQRWYRAATTAGVSLRPAAFIRLDGDRLTDLTARITGAAAPAAHWGSDRTLLRVAAPGRDDAVVIDAMVSEVAGRLGVDLDIERIAVRKIGKTAVFLSAADGRRYIMRIARSPVALARAVRNFDTLEWLGASSVAEAVKQRAPAAVVRGTHGGYAYFVESCLPGRSGPVGTPKRPAGNGWEMEAVSYLTALHTATMHRTTMDEDVMTRLVREPVSRIAAVCASAAADRVLGRVLAACEAGLAGRVLPLVQTHGDFTESNCLFDADGRVTAVVDWELAMRHGLPLLDLLQLMPIMSETASAPRWQRFDTWVGLVREPQRVIADAVMGAYLRALDVATATVPALVLVQWVSHVADRIEARCDDERWMRLRLRQPLESLGRILCD